MLSVSKEKSYFEWFVTCREVIRAACMVTAFYILFMLDFQNCSVFGTTEEMSETSANTPA